MLFQPRAAGSFYKAGEADSFRGLVAALLNDPGYEKAPLEERLQRRLRMAEDLALLASVESHELKVSDRKEPAAVKSRRGRVALESELDRLGVECVHSTPYHPPDLRQGGTLPPDLEALPGQTGAG